jgi:2-dehydropantoate 2-reductase
MDVVVHGAGSLGTLVGGLLARAHDVTLVGRDPHVSAVQDEGLRVDGVESVAVSPDATTDGTGLSGDLAIVTVKAFDTEAAARELATGTFETVLSLQNGMGNEEALAQSLSCPVLAGTTTHGALLATAGAVEWTGRGEIVLGPWHSGAMEPARRVARAFENGGLAVTVEEDMQARLWEKLAVNAAINPVTALARIENGKLVSGPASDCAQEAAREVATVARAEGVDLSEERAVTRAREVAEATATNQSSMYQDVAAGRRTEIDAICGFVCERAADAGLAVPVNRTLRDLVRGWEASRGLR